MRSRDGIEVDRRNILEEPSLVQDASRAVSVIRRYTKERSTYPTTYLAMSPPRLYPVTENRVTFLPSSSSFLTSSKICP